MVGGRGGSAAGEEHVGELHSVQVGRTRDVYRLREDPVDAYGHLLCHGL